MAALFHEKQEGQLCAQHALNSLLQGAYFTAVDLADIGQQLDNEEQASMNVVDSKEPVDPATAEQPKSDMKKPESSNFDDSGYFSIQVLNRALQIWALDLIPIGSTDAQGALEDPTKEVAFICNLQNHWLTLRRFGYRKLWYNLDSTLSAPSYISDTYLGLFLAQLKSDSYHIFVVRGNLARSEGDDFIDTSPEDQIPYHTKVSSPKKALPQGRSLNEKTQEELELEKAIAMSFGPLEGDGEATDEEALLQMAIDQSLQQDRTSSTRKADDAQLPVDEMRQKRLNKFLG